MKKKVLIVIAFIIILGIGLFVLAGYFSNKNDDINTAKVIYPVPTKAEETVDVTASLAIDYYMTARAYLDQFLNYDIENMDENEFNEYKVLLDNSITAFEKADKVNSALEETIDTWEKAEGDQSPTYEEAKMNLQPVFGFTAYAAEDSSSVKWAKDITDKFDKAPAGKGIRTLASQLGTDCKHAYAQLKQAQAILEGAEYTSIADKANTAYKTASVLKTAGTAAGLVISVATAPASGAIATAISTGGITVNGINTLLEIGSTGSILYTNGEENEFSMACDKTEAQLAPIGQIFSIAGLGSSIKDISSTGKQILQNGYKSLDSKQSAELAINTFGLISYTGNSINDYMNDGSILGGTFKNTDNGIELTLMDTLTGSKVQEKENIKNILNNVGTNQKDIETAIKNVEENSDNLTGTMTTDSIPSEIANSIIEKNSAIMEDDFDVEAYINNLRNVLYEIASMKDDSTEPTETDESLDSEATDLDESQPEQGVDSFMGSWTYTDYNKSEEGVFVRWTMSHSGDSISLRVAQFEDEDNPTTYSVTCSYEYENNVLSLYGESLGDGKFEFRLIDDNTISATSYGMSVMTTTMKRSSN